MAVALVIFARWSPIRCGRCSAAVRCAGAIGPALQSVASRRAIISSCGPYILTLFIMIASAGSKRAMRDVPGELSITK